jgi:hypothetical protein
MLSAEIKINRRTIERITAVNLGDVKSKPNTQWRWYGLDCGCKLKHNRDKGALCLLIQVAGHAMLCKKRHAR